MNKAQMIAEILSAMDSYGITIADLDAARAPKQTETESAPLSQPEIQAVVNEGVAPETVADMQATRSEVTEAPVIRPSELEGVSNEVTLSAQELTARLVALESAFKNFKMQVEPVLLAEMCRK